MLKTSFFSLGSLFVCSALQAQILVNDLFTDGERAAQNLPASLQYFSGGVTADTIVNGANELEVNNITTANTTRGVAGYFQASGSPLQLAVGEKLRLSFDLRLPGSNVNSDKAFQFWLFDSGATRVAVDNHGFNNGAFSNDYGYGVTASLNLDTGGRYRLVERGPDATPTNNFVGDQVNLATAGTAAGTGVVLQSGVGAPLYSAYLEITRTASGTDLLGSINGKTVLFSDTAGNIFNQFDGFGIFSISGGVVGSPNISEFDIDNVVMLYTSVVPEPSTGLFFLGGIAALACLRKRARDKDLS